MKMIRLASRLGLLHSLAAALAFGVIAFAQATLVSEFAKSVMLEIQGDIYEIEKELQLAESFSLSFEEMKVANRIAVDATGRYAVTASEHNTAQVWELASGTLLSVLRVPAGENCESETYPAALSPDGRLVVLGDRIVVRHKVDIGSTKTWGKAAPRAREHSLCLFDRHTGRMQGRIGGLPELIHHLAFSADGSHFAAAFQGKNGIRVYRAQPPWKEVARDADYGGTSASHVDFDRKGRLVATGDDGKLRLYDAAFRRIAIREVAGGKRPYFARFSPDGKRIAVGFAGTTTVSVVSAEDLSLLYQADTHGIDNGDLSSVAWSADGEILYAAGRNNLSDGRKPIRYWREQGRGTMQTWPLPTATNTVMDLRALAGGKLVFASKDPAWAVLDQEGRLVAWRSPRPVRRSDFASLRLGRAGEIVEFLPETGRLEKTLVRFDLAARRLERGVKPGTDLAAPRTEGLPVRDWEDSLTPRLRGQPLQLEPYERSRSLAISHDAKRFALGADWNIYLFDSRGRRQWKKPVPGIAPLVNLTADGRFVVASLGDGTLRWYRTEDGSEALALFVHAYGTHWVLWTPDGFYDASPGADSLIGYRVNQGHDKEGEFVGSGQLASVFYRPDLVARRLAGDEAPIAKAVKQVGDVRQVLAAGLAPQIELVSPAESTSSGDYELRFRIAERRGGVGQVEIRINGKLVEGRTDPPTGGMYSQRLSLAEGRNVVTTALYSRDNKQASKPMRVVVNVAPSGAKPTLHVLAVGVTGYRDAALAQGVRFAADDAAAFAKTLGDRGLSATAEVATPVVLTEREATRERIVAELEGFAARVKPEDLFVLYLAGHGTSLDDGEYYYMPWELRYTGRTAIMEQALSGARLRELLGRVTANKNLVVLDTCSSGAFSLKVAGRDLGDKASIDRFARLSGRVVLAASGDQRMALESPDNQHGIFTGALISGLQGEADANGNGLVEVGELADYVEREVASISLRLFNQEQFPMRETQGQNFPVTRKGKAGGR